MKNSSTHQYEQNHFVGKVMKKIKSISELDHSQNYQLSKDYYENNKTFNGIEEFLKSHGKQNKSEDE